MTDYTGDRTIDGIEVTADGEPLDPRFELRTFSELGFEWTYEGAEPRQLSLALLCHHLAQQSGPAVEQRVSDQRALALTEPFMSSIVANFANTWTMSSDDIAAAIAHIES